MTCDGCHAVPAVLHVTVRRTGEEYATGHFCEACYLALSRDQISDFAHPRPEELPAQRGEPEEHFAMFLRGMTLGLTEGDIREVVELTLREVRRRGRLR